MPEFECLNRGKDFSGFTYDEENPDLYDGLCGEGFVNPNLIFEDEDSIIEKIDRDNEIEKLVSKLKGSDGDFDYFEYEKLLEAYPDYREKIQGIAKEQYPDSFEEEISEDMFDGMSVANKSKEIGVTLEKTTKKINRQKLSTKGDLGGALADVYKY